MTEDSEYILFEEAIPLETPKTTKTIAAEAFFHLLGLLHLFFFFFKDQNQKFKIQKFKTSKKKSSLFKGFCQCHSKRSLLSN